MSEAGLRITGHGRRAAAPIAAAGAGHDVALTPIKAASGLTAAWAELASRAAEDNVFFHPDFALPAAAYLDDGVALASVRAPGGRLVAAAPVTHTRLGRIAPAVRSWAHDYAPLGVPLVDRDDVDAAVAALIEGLAPAGSGSSVILPAMPLDGPVAAAAQRHAETVGRPVTIADARHRATLSRPETGPVDMRGGLPTRRRKEFARQMRRLGEAGPLSVETTTEPDCVRARFEEFMALEAAGWKGRRGSALASETATAAFAREAVFERSAHGGVRIDSIRVGDHTVAILVCFVAGATAYSWKIAYDEAYEHFSPGAQLMLEVPAHLFSDAAVMRIDSCAAPNHPMIDHLWRERLAVGTLVIGPVGGGALHRLGLAAAQAEVEARGLARRLRGTRH